MGRMGAVGLTPPTGWFWFPEYSDERKAKIGVYGTLAGPGRNRTCLHPDNRLSGARPSIRGGEHKERRSAASFAVITERLGLAFGRTIAFAQWVEWVPRGL